MADKGIKSDTADIRLKCQDKRAGSQGTKEMGSPLPLVYLIFFKLGVNLRGNNTFLCAINVHVC